MTFYLFLVGMNIQINTGFRNGIFDEKKTLMNNFVYVTGVCW